ncbi:sigma-70 family RNA polymerase sigma factor [uncultured Gimesia sp.]|uniref:RNA polymerase sigma factor n=1 Tax=uncultured Gimesia sp. TaxID=1678688 RepID=UPI002624C792|nr:sigma-70 family RNA polymerase sigma factor [uncultured Gimesia sp.]
MTLQSDLHNLDDAELVALTLREDREAFGILYDRYARWVRAVVYPTTGSREELQDITQEVFLRAYKNLPDLNEAAQFRYWVVAISRRVSQERSRSRRRDRHRYIGDAAETEDQNEIMTGEEIKLVLRETAQLPENERLAIHAFYLEGKDVEATAKLLNMSRSGVYAALQRACKKLAQRLRPLDCESEE